MNDRRAEWDASYALKQNHLYYPNEEVIRFVSRFFRQRVGLNEYRDKRGFQSAPRSLDLGCGIGRHVIYLHEVGFESHGIDLSAEAIASARAWASVVGIPVDRFVEGTSSVLPWKPGHFDCVVSHGVLDSMPFEVARRTMAEVDRVLADDGLAYIDLISGDDDRHVPGFAGEDVVEGAHERGTIQSYFDEAKVEALVADTALVVKERVLVRRTQLDNGRIDARYHLVLSRS
jgi:SAM-dependent methyltransferase